MNDNKFKDLKALFKGKFTNLIDFYNAGHKYMTPLQRSRLEKRISGLTVTQIANEEKTSVRAVSKSLQDAINTVKRKISKFNQEIIL